MLADAGQATIPAKVVAMAATTVVVVVMVEV